MDLQHLTGFGLLKKLIQEHASNECLTWPMKRDHDGYGRVWYQGKPVGAHRLAFFVVHGRWPVPNALHSCDNPPCFNPRHLSEGSNLLNQNQKAKRGRSLRGVQQHDAKLTDDAVQQARAEYIPRKMGFHQLAKKYGVSKPAMRWAIIGKTWRHVPGGNVPREKERCG